MGVKWTNEEDERLIAYLNEGKTSREIGALLNRPRNAVIGRAHRLRNPDAPPRPRIVTVRRPKVKLICESESNLANSLLKLRNDQCRWPLETTFCTEEKAPGKPYCLGHAAQAYRPSIRS